MKKATLNLLVSLSMLFSGVCIAQPVLSQGNSAPVSGESFNINTCNYVAPGSAGPSQT